MTDWEDDRTYVVGQPGAADPPAGPDDPLRCGLCGDPIRRGAQSGRWTHDIAGWRLHDAIPPRVRDADDPMVVHGSLSLQRDDDDGELHATCKCGVRATFTDGGAGDRAHARTWWEQHQRDAQPPADPTARDDDPVATSGQAWRRARAVPAARADVDHLNAAILALLPPALDFRCDNCHGHCRCDPGEQARVDAILDAWADSGWDIRRGASLARLAARATAPAGQQDGGGQP